MIKVAPQLFVKSIDLRELLRFLIVGTSNFVVSFTVFYLLYEYWQVASFLLDGIGFGGETIARALSKLGFESPEAGLANAIGYLCGIINSFIWNRAWTFKVMSRTTARLTRFIILNISLLAISSIILFIFVDIFHNPYQIVWVVTMGFITILNFAGSKYWTFRQ